MATKSVLMILATLVTLMAAASTGYVIQPADNNTDDWARIDFEFRISDGSEAYRSKTDADRTGPLWVRKIFNVEGVEALDVRQHSLLVRKSTLGKWEHILVPVAEIVAEENRKKK